MLVEYPRSGVALVTFDQERLDALNSPTIKQRLLELIETGRGQLVLDLGSIRFIDSSGLGALVSVLKRAGMQGGIRICRLQAPVAATFRLARMDRVFPIFDEAAAAVASL
jgi:anti-sigma B factor antagonist